jgi:basic amino acid/polyamine antiporter, APA family
MAAGLVATESATVPSSSLRGDLRAFDLIVVGTGAIIGVGWVIMVGAWLAAAGPGGTIVAFALATLAVMFVGFCYGEMAAIAPRAGGELIYAYVTLGLPAAYGIGWLIAFNLILICAFEAIAAGWLLESIFPALRIGTAYELAGTSVSIGTLLIGLVGTVLIAALNAHGSRSSARFQMTFTTTKLLLAVVLIALCIVHGNPANLRPLFGGVDWRGSGPDWIGILTVLSQAPFFLGGFQVIPQLVEERTQGARAGSIGVAIMISLSVALCFYVGIAVAIAIVAPRGSWLADQLPAYTAVRVGLNSAWPGNALLGIALLGTLSTWNAMFIWATRLLFALSRAHLAPAYLSAQAGRAATPIGAILFAAILSGCGILPGRALLSSFVNSGSIVVAMAMLVTCICAWRLTRATTELRRRVIIYCATVVSGAILLIAIATPALRPSKIGIPVEWAVLLGWSVIIVALWFANRRRCRAIDEPERRQRLLG